MVHFPWQTVGLLEGTIALFKRNTTDLLFAGFGVTKLGDAKSERPKRNLPPENCTNCHRWKVEDLTKKDSDNPSASNRNIWTEPGLKQTHLTS